MDSLSPMKSSEMQSESHHLSYEWEMTFLIFDFTILIPVGYFHHLINCMIKREKEEKGHGLIKNLLDCYVIIVPFVFFTCMTYIHIILRYTSTPAHVFGDGFCYAYEIFAHSGGMYVGAFSLFTAIVKYWFIVCNAKSKHVGETKIRNIFTICYCTIPIIMATMNSLSNGNTDPVMWVNLCWRKTPTENAKNNLTIVADDDFFCNNKKYEIEDYVGATFSEYLTPVLRGTCRSVKILYAIFFSNIVELVIYFLIFRYLNR